MKRMMASEINYFSETLLLDRFAKRIQILPKTIFSYEVCPTQTFLDPTSDITNIRRKMQSIVTSWTHFFSS